MYVPIGMGILTAAAYLMKLRRDNKPVPPEQAAERAVIYDTAINTVKDPDQLRKLAGAFASAGLTAEAHMLSLRADNAEAPPEVKAARKEAFRQGMESANIPAIIVLAEAFEAQGAPGAALALREHAAEVANTPVEQTPEATAEYSPPPFVDADEPISSTKVTEEKSDEQPNEQDETTLEAVGS
jgi:hypothetical protein